MDQFIEEIEEDDLKFVLCFYSNSVIHHEYDSKTNSLSQGSLLTTNSLKAIFNFVLEDTSLKKTEYGFASIIPSNVLKFSSKSKRIVWVTPEREKKLLYQKSCPVKSGKYRIPAMAWVLKGNSLDVYALQSTENITEKTKLYNAPFFNISYAGLVCMGNAVFDNKFTDYSKIIIDVENKFFNSYFTHSNNNELLKKTNFTTYCEKVLNKNVFDNKLLIENELIIKNLL